MLTAPGLAALERSLADVRVLSVYLDGVATDPAERQRWQRELEPRLRALRHGLETAPHAERVEFERCVDALHEELASVRDAIGAPSLVAFVTGDGVQYVEALPVRIATSVTWQDGPETVPYLAVLRMPAPIYLAMVDRVQAEVLRVDEGATTRLASFRTDLEVQTTPHMGDAPRHGFHVGTRGSTNTDEAQRLRAEETHRLLADVAADLATRGAHAGFLVLGGNATLLPRLCALLPDSVSARTTIEPSLVMDATPSARAMLARAAAERLRESAELAQLASIESAAASGGRGTLGPSSTAAALARAQVREVLVTHRWLAEHPADARTTVRAAFAQGATVEEVAGQAEAWLDAHGGIAAALRYPTPRETRR